MKELSSNCSTETSDYNYRLESLRDLSLRGSSESLFAWASMKAFGFDSAASSCPFSQKKFLSADPFVHQSAAFYGFIGALYMGEPQAILPIAYILSSGLGTLYTKESFEDALSEVPLPFEHREHFKAEGSLVDRLRQYTITNQVSYPQNTYLDTNLSLIARHSINSSIVMGLLLFASMLNMDEARAVLSHRFEYGFGVEKDQETSLFYLYTTAKMASLEFHRRGGEPIAERDRIDDLTEKEVFKGNLGDEDEIIQLQMVKAKEGDLPSILAMGDLYYYGARGMPRNQMLAREFFSDAASRGSLEGVCGLAGMHLKGEGGPKNLSKAIELYESAASEGSIRALNGLGYLYFFGEEIEKNEV